MKVILLERVSNLGELGSIINVKPGYARNYLLPKGKAVIANKENILYFNERQEELVKISTDKLQFAKQRAEKLHGLNVTIAARAGEKGKLYGSIGSNEIFLAIKNAGVDVDKDEIHLPNGVFRMIGDYIVSLRLYNKDVTTNINLSIVPGE